MNVLKIYVSYMRFTTWYCRLGYQAGLWHDLEKFNPVFQDYLKAQTKGSLLSIVQVAIRPLRFEQPIGSE
jgi:hypothetical protein